MMHGRWEPRPKRSEMVHAAERKDEGLPLWQARRERADELAEW